MWGHHLRHPSSWKRENIHPQKTSSFILREVFKKHRINCSLELHCTLRESRQIKLSYMCNFLTEKTNPVLIKLLLSCMLPICFNLFFSQLIQNLGAKGHPPTTFLLAHSWALTKAVNILLNCVLQNTFSLSFSIHTLLNIKLSPLQTHSTFIPPSTIPFLCTWSCGFLRQSLSCSTFHT